MAERANKRPPSQPLRVTENKSRTLKRLDSVEWQSPLDRVQLKQRAELYSTVRRFFAIRDVVEVEVPILGATTVTDPYLNAWAVKADGNDYFLQTSPEFFMKRLLAGGSGSIYYLGKAFRLDEAGTRHNPEFTMLEWYREGFSDTDLIDEVSALIQAISPEVTSRVVGYGELFTGHIGCNPHTASLQELKDKARDLLDIHWDDEDRNTWCDLLFSHLIEPKLQELTIVRDYPASMCALAKVTKNADGLAVARRFEVFWHGIELANGYWELTDVSEQRARFEHDQQIRASKGLPVPKLDDKFLAAIESGLPECAGIALGIDRLFMCLRDSQNISESLPFPFSHL